MGDSTRATAAPLSGDGLLTAAMAFRVKYRKADANGVAKKTFVPIGSLGVHARNRGGVYPSGMRVKSLCQEVLENGFVKEEVNHACIVVEEPPLTISFTFPQSRR